MLVVNLCILALAVNILETHSVMEGKIVGGEYVSIRSAPHSVFVYIFGPDEDVDDWCCGGSVLNQNLVLTAAHCLDNQEEEGQVNIVAGHSNIEEADIVRPVRRFIQHTDYTKSTGYCDIALMSVKHALPLCYNIRRVIVSPLFPEFDYGKVSGWGLTSPHEDQPSINLKSVKQKLMPTGECDNLRKSGMKPGTMCGSSGSRLDYPTSGDSGSALVTPEHQQVGVVSTGFRHRRDIIIYSNVSYYYYWIQKVSKLLYCHNRWMKSDKLMEESDIILNPN